MPPQVNGSVSIVVPLKVHEGVRCDDDDDDDGLWDDDIRALF